MHYRIIPFVRIEPAENAEIKSIEEAQVEKEQLQVMHPENIYVIVDEDGNVVDA